MWWRWQAWRARREAARLESAARAYPPLAGEFLPLAAALRAVAGRGKVKA